MDSPSHFLRFAEQCKVSRQALAKWESGESIPNLEKLIFLADFFGISLDELVGRVIKDDYARFEEFIKKFIPEKVNFKDDDEIITIIGRYMCFMSEINVSEEDKLRGLQKIFLAGTDEA